MSLMRVEGEQDPAWGKAGRNLGRARDEGAKAALSNAAPGASITLRMRAGVWRCLKGQHHRDPPRSARLGHCSALQLMAAAGV